MFDEIRFSTFFVFVFVFSSENQNVVEAQTLIERLKRTLDETVHERDQLTKTLSNANKKVKKKKTFFFSRRRRFFFSF